jgi:O-antigen/teichoic acid export membrane protein
MLRSALRRNLAANFVAQAWAIGLGIISVPLLLHLLGAEGYGLVGFAASLQAVLAVLDLGLATTANREFSRTAGLNRLVRARVLLRTLEWTYFGMGAAIALVVVAAAPHLAARWVHAEGIPSATIRNSLMLLGVAIGLRWPLGLYAGVLRGLERQVSLNLVAMTGSALRTVGAAFVLFLFGGGILRYFVWFAAASVLETAATAWLAWRAQPAEATAPARFDRGLLRSLWRFSGQVSLIAVFAAVLKQMDRIVIAGLEPLGALGYYTVASTLSGGLLLGAAPVFTAVFPRLSSLFARAEDAEAARLYHRASRLVAVVSAPIAAALAFFPGTALLLWTRSPQVASAAALPLSALAFAMLLNACMQVPYALQLAAGLTHISLWINGVGALVLLPLLVVLVRAHGIAGAGLAWALFNIAYLAVAPVLLHRRVLRGHLRRWLLQDTLPFLLLALVCYGGAAWLARQPTSVPVALLLLGGATIAYVAIVALTFGRGRTNFHGFPGMSAAAGRDP